MTTEPAASDHHPLTFEGIDSWFERLLGCDFRLLYGIGLPVFGLIALLVLGMETTLIPREALSSSHRSRSSPCSWWCGA